MAKLIKKPTRRISIHGHRGSRGTHPENSIPAFEEAVRSGADYFECDVHLTKDDEVVVFHDFSISDKLCSAEGGKKMERPISIRSLAMADVSKFTLGDRLQSHFPKQQLIPGTVIPTLQQVLAWSAASAPHMGLNIEIKMSKEEPNQPNAEHFTQKVFQLLDKYKTIPRTLVQSFDFRPLECAKKMSPQCLLSYLFESELDFAQIASDRAARVVAPFFGLVTPEAVRFCHDRAIQVLPWTVNERTDWENLIEMGVDGVITDFPSLLIQSGMADEKD